MKRIYTLAMATALALTAVAATGLELRGNLALNAKQAVATSITTIAAKASLTLPGTSLKAKKPHRPQTWKVITPSPSATTISSRVSAI